MAYYLKLRAEVGQIGHLVRCIWLRLGGPVYQDDLFSGCELPFAVGVPFSPRYIPPEPAIVGIQVI